MADIPIEPDQHRPIPKVGNEFSISGLTSHAEHTTLRHGTDRLRQVWSSMTRRSIAVLSLLFAAAIAAVPLDALAFLRATPKAAIAVPESPEPPRQTANAHAARAAIDANSIHDPANPDLGRLQTINEATRNLPADSIGFPDWMRALREGLIKPRSSLDGKGSMEVLDMDVIMKNTREMPYVRFPHRSHTMWLDCSNCHPAPFKPVAGSTAIRMADIFRGQYCGMCHDRVAFITFFSCNRCHSVAQPVGGK